MTTPVQGPDQAQAAQLLQDMGLTATEAAVYCKALQLCTSGAVSSYKLAQAMGRDPANVAKTLSALVRLQAINVVQDKPRLYLPTDPGKFTERVLNRLQHSGQAAVDLLRQFQVPQLEGVPLALASSRQVYDTARTLLADCQTRALVFGAKESLREIGAELEGLAEIPGRRVQVLSPTAMVSDQVEIAVFSPLSDLAELTSHEYLQLVVDDRVWLSAMLTDGTEPGPTGWWGDNSSMAAVLGGSLTLAWQSGHLATESVGPPPVAEPVMSPAEEPVLLPQPTPEAATEPEPEPEFEEGLTFLVRHADEDHQKKGEQ